MTVTVRADDVPAASRAEYWRHVVGDTEVPMEVRVDHGPDFPNRLVAGNVGGLWVSDVTSGPGESLRTWRHVRRSAPDFYQVWVQVRGHAMAEQDGRAARLRPGDFALSDLARPFRCAYPAFRGISVRFPRFLLPAHDVDLVRGLTGVRMAGDRGAGTLVSSLIRRLPRYLEDRDDADGTRVGTAVLDLLATALAGHVDRGDTIPPDPAQRALRLRIHAFIEQRLADPELAPALIAEAHHISVRYLHKLFEAEETTVAALIRRRRLDRCRRDLVDPSLVLRPVSAIGARWGFTSAAHFGKLFRLAYGLTPVEYRTKVAPRGSAG